MTKKNHKAVFSIYLIYFISMVLFTTVRILVNLGVLENLHDQLSSLVFTIIIQLLIMFLIPTSLYIIYRFFQTRKENKPATISNEVKETFNLMGFKKVSLKVVAITIALGFLAFFLNIAVSSVFNSIIHFFGYEFSPSGASTELLPVAKEWQLLFDLLLVAVFPAFCEEILHRGLLLNVTSKIGYKKAIVISSLLFGLVHFNIQQVSYAFVLGMLIALIAVVSKSIWPAIIVHFINNATSVYIGFANKHNWFGGNFYEKLQAFLGSDNILLSYMISLTSLVLLLVAIYVLIVSLYKETTVKRVNKALRAVLSEDFVAPTESGLKTTLTEKEIISNEILINNSNINLAISKDSDPFDILLPIIRDQISPSFKDNIFLYASVILGGLITIFTFVWGVL